MKIKKGEILGYIFESDVLLSLRQCIFSNKFRKRREKKYSAKNAILAQILIRAVIKILSLKTIVKKNDVACCCAHKIKFLFSYKIHAANFSFSHLESKTFWIENRNELTMQNHKLKKKPFHAFPGLRKEKKAVSSL